MRWLSIFDDLQKIDDAAQGARMLAISFCAQYLSGYRVDLAKIGEICSRRKLSVFCRCDPGHGRIPYRCGSGARSTHALAADGHKWMLGPEGCGILYVRAERQDEIAPVQIGWTNFAHYADSRLRAI